MFQLNTSNRKLFPQHLNARRFVKILIIFTSFIMTAQAKPLDLDRLRDEAKSAYAKGKYSVAQRNFTKIVQVLPLSASDYLMLARSAYSNEDHAHASVAYSFYFKLNRRPDQRPKDEYKRVKSLVIAQKDKRFIEGTLERVKQIEALAKMGELSGSKGAFKALSRLRREGLFHPRLKQAYQSIEQAIEQVHQELVSQWWDATQIAEPNELTALMERWDHWAQLGLGDPEKIKTFQTQLDGMIKLKTNPTEALSLMKEASQQSGSYDLSQRYLLLLALTQAGNQGEALELTRSLLTRAQGADLERLSVLEAHLITQSSLKAGQAPTEEQLMTLVDQLYRHAPLVKASVATPKQN